MMIKVHPLFLVMLIVWILSGQIHQYALLMGALLWHELGHIAVSKWYGVRIEKLTLLPFGGRIELGSQASFHQRMWIASGGPIFTVIAYIGGAYLPILWQEPWQTLQIALLLVNLLPVYPLDGGQIISNAILTVYPTTKLYEIYIAWSFYALTFLVVMTLFMLPETIIVLTLSLLLWSETLAEWKIRKYRTAYEKIVLRRLT